MDRASINPGTLTPVFAADAGVFVLRSATAVSLHLRPEHAWLQLDVGLERLLCGRCGSGEAIYPKRCSTN